MPLTNAGRDIIAAALTGVGTPTLFNNANAYLGTGTSTTAFAAAQTDLQTAGVRKGMEASYPQVADNVITFRSVFATGEANQAWAEFGVFNAASGGTMLCRKVEALGTKTSAQAWQFTVDVAVVNGDA